MNAPEMRKPAVLCKNLRCKEMFYQAFDPDDAITPMSFWCTRTNDAVGPDGLGADNLECRPTRGCFGK